MILKHCPFPEPAYLLLCTLSLSVVYSPSVLHKNGVCLLKSWAEEHPLHVRQEQERTE